MKVLIELTYDRKAKLLKIVQLLQSSYYMYSDHSRDTMFWEIVYSESPWSIGHALCATGLNAVGLPNPIFITIDYKVLLQLYKGLE